METKCKWLKLFLVVSLAINLTIAAPYLYRKLISKEGKPSRLMEISSGLDLKDEQKEKIDAIVKEFKLSLMQFKQDILEKRIDIIDELGDPEFDPADITARARELNKLYSELNLLFVETLMRINAQLDSRQRLDFLYRLSKDWFFLNRQLREKDKKRGNHE